MDTAPTSTSPDPDVSAILNEINGAVNRFADSWERANLPPCHSMRNLAPCHSMINPTNVKLALERLKRAEAHYEVQDRIKELRFLLTVNINNLSW